MNRKTFFVILALIIFVLIALFLYFFLFKGDKEPYETIPVNIPPVTFPINTDVSTSTVVTPPVSQPVSDIDKTCGSSANSFERNDCIHRVAVEQKDDSLCDFVEGMLAENACKREVKLSTAPIITSTPTTPPQYEAYIKTFLATQNEVQANPLISASNQNSSAPAVSLPPIPQGPSNDESAFLHNISFGAPLVVYATSKKEVSPGESLKIYGSGFDRTENTVYIGNNQIVVDSSDGNTLEIMAPGSTGEYEIWVTNSKGSSQLTDRKVLLTVTNSPRPLPVIQSATPNPVAVNGTVELRGTGFGPTNNIFTTFGTLMNVPSSDGTTIRFDISSLEYILPVAAMQQLRGKTLPIQVNLQTEHGVIEQIFEFNIQF